MTWDGSDRKARLPREWHRIRRRVLIRDSYQCQHRDNGVKCGATANQVDHIVPGDDHSEANLQALCVTHHRAKSSREGVEARAKIPRRARPTENHPGFLNI